MKKTQIKDIQRNIVKTKISFLSIAIIVMLGVATYLGITYAGQALKESGDTYYREQNYEDIDLVATLGLSDKDIEAVKAIDGIDDCEGGYVSSGQVSKDNLHKSVKILSITKKINVVRVIEGKLPTKKNECAIEQSIADSFGYKLQDTISITSDGTKPASYLSEKDFVITAIINHPDHITSNTYGSPYICVDEQAFDREQTDGHYMKMYVTLQNKDSYSSFSDKYSNLLEPVWDKLKTVSTERAAIRDDEIYSDAQKKISNQQTEIDKAQQKLDTSKEKLDAAKKKLDAAKKKLEKAQEELDLGKKKLDEGKAKLLTAKKKLDAAKKKLTAGKKQLDEAKKKLAQMKKKIDASSKSIIEYKKKMERKLYTYVTNKIELTKKQKMDYDEFRRHLDFSKSTKKIIREELEWVAERVRDYFSDEEIETNRAEIRKKIMEYPAVKKLIRVEEDLADAKALYKQKLAEYNTGKETYRKQLAAYNKNYKKYLAGMKTYQEGLREYKKSNKLFQKKKKEYEEGLAEYNKKYDQYANGCSQLDLAKTDLDKAKEQIENLEKCKYYQFDRTANAAYMDLDMSSNNLSSLALSFALMLIIVAAMVSYATIGRMVEEQRQIIGMSKALGFMFGEIFAKYIVFALEATILGVLAGIPIAYYVLQKIILSGYGFMYQFGKASSILMIEITTIVVACALILSIISVVSACYRLLKLPATVLMRDKVEDKQRKKRSRRSKRIPLFTRITIRNVKTDRKRVLTTIFGVAGCSALLVIGFTLKTSVEQVADLQYGTIIHYDKQVTMDEHASDIDKENMVKTVTDSGASCIQVGDQLTSYDVDGKVDMTELYCSQSKDFTSYYSLKDVETGKELSLSDEGVLIQKRMSEVYELTAGDEFTLFDSAGKGVKVKVAGVFNNYAGRTMIITPTYYQKVFGHTCEMNSYFIKLQGTDGEALKQSLAKMNGYISCDNSDSSRSMFASISTTLNAVIGLLILLAVVMALVVLLNLSYMHVNQKSRELTIMRINGFSLKQTIDYIVNETIFITIIGLAAGMGIGSALAYVIIRNLEKPHLQLVRSVSFSSWMLSIAITILFSLIVNAIALRKVKHLKLSDMS